MLKIVTGKTGEQTNVVALEVPGFTARPVTQKTIAGDGSTIVDVYYDRNSYTLTLNKGTGISSVSGAGTYKYGASASISATASTGYTFTSWSVTSGNTPASTTSASTTVTITGTTTLQANASDTTGISEYCFKIGTGSYTCQSSNTYTWSNLTPETNYNIKAMVKATHVGTNASDTTATSSTLTVRTLVDQANIRLKKSGHWVKGKGYYKKNGHWEKIKKIYIKKNGHWEEGRN